MRLTDAYMGTKNQFGELGLITGEPGGSARLQLPKLWEPSLQIMLRMVHLTLPHQTTTSQQQQLHYYNYFRHNVKVIFGRFLLQCI